MYLLGLGLGKAWETTYTNLVPPIKTGKNDGANKDFPCSGDAKASKGPSLG